MTTVSDNFNRADETPLASPWVTVGSTGCKLVSNVVRGNGADVRTCSRYGGSGIGANQYAQCVVDTAVTGAGRDIGVAVRCSTSVDSYYAYRSDNSASEIIKCVTGTVTSLVGSGAAFAATDTIYLEANGTSLQAKRNGSNTLSVTDSDLTTGDPGVHVLDENVHQIDTFTAGDLAAATFWGGSLNDHWDRIVQP